MVSLECKVWTEKCRVASGFARLLTSEDRANHMNDKRWGIREKRRASGAVGVGKAQPVPEARRQLPKARAGEQALRGEGHQGAPWQAHPFPNQSRPRHALMDILSSLQMFKLSGRQEPPLNDLKDLASPSAKFKWKRLNTSPQAKRHRSSLLWQS